MGEVFQLIDAPISQETISALRFLLHEARGGRISGIAYVAIRRGQDFSADFAGRAEDCPTLTRGALRALDDELSKFI